MARWFVSSLLVLGAIVLVGAPASAAAFGPDEMITKVPFQFVVGGTVLPAGRYEVRASTMSPSVVWLVGADGRHVAVATTVWGGRSFKGSQPDLKFDIYGHTRFLDQVEFPGEAARTLPMTPKEVEHELTRLAEQRAERGNS